MAEQVGASEHQLPDATVDPKTMPSFGDLARQFDSKGFPGITASVEQPADFPGVTVDALQYRALNGELVGILIHYGETVPGLERAGNVNIWVRKDHQRKGIATSLVRRALRRWPDIDVMQQNYIPSGRAVVSGISDPSQPCGQ